MPPWKRAMDLFVILLLLPLWLPLMLVIAVGIKLVSRGPVFFRQERIGHRGRRFLCYKFRSMRCNADASTHKEHVSQLINSNNPMVKLDQKSDPRVIPLGGLLRASGFDELPQLFNVIRGDMSLVGPRPCMDYEYEGYEPRHKERFAVFPGLTGLWQVSGKNQTTFEQMIQLDLKYGRELSLKNDLWILIRTGEVLIRQIMEFLRARLKANNV